MAVSGCKPDERAFPLSRWPQLAVDSALPANDPARAGQALFIVQCLTCHKLKGGPPMSALISTCRKIRPNISRATGSARYNQ
jgi:cytochrome c